MEEEEKLKELEETARREKAPRTLLGQEDHGKEERERVERLCEAYDEFAQLERQNAQHFLEVLIDLLPSVLVVKSSIEADQALQEFASKYCEGLLFLSLHNFIMFFIAAFSLHEYSNLKSNHFNG